MKLKPKSTTHNARALLYKRFISLEKSENSQNVYNTEDGKLWIFDTSSKTFRQVDSTFITNQTIIVRVENLATALSYGTTYYRYYSQGWGYAILDDKTYTPRYNFAPFTLTAGVEREIVLTDYQPTIIGGSAAKSITFYLYAPENHITIYAINLITGQEEKYLEINYNYVPGTAPPTRIAINPQPVKITKIVLRAKSDEDKTISNSAISFEAGVFLSNPTKLLSGTFGNIGRYQTNKYYFAGTFDYMLKGGIETTTMQYIRGNITPAHSLNIKYFDDEIRLSPDDLVVIENRLYSVENPQIDNKHMPKDYSIYFATLNSIL